MVWLVVWLVWFRFPSDNRPGIKASRWHRGSNRQQDKRKTDGEPMSRLRVCKPKDDNCARCVIRRNHLPLCKTQESRVSIESEQQLPASFHLRILGFDHIGRRDWHTDGNFFTLRGDF
jgi:hypothetical protein